MANASTGLEKEDHQRDAAFNKALHGKSSQATGGFTAMMGKDKEAQRLALEEYFKHFDNKIAADETTADREVSLSFKMACHGVFVTVGKNL
jgi:sterol 24-C-methyltransferase